MARLANLARMTTATIGTGTITLGAAVSGCLTFALACAAAGIASGSTVTYGIEDGSNSEVGRGVWTTPSTLTRATILASTNSNNAISLSGTAEVFIMAAAEDILSGSIYPAFTSPVLADFTAINSASGTTNANGGVFLSAPASASDNARLYTKAAPATPYTITAFIIPNLVSVQYLFCGLCWRQSSDGKFITVGITTGTVIGDLSLSCRDWTNVTTLTADNAILLVPFTGSPIFLRIADNGTNRIASWSKDGYNFKTLFSETRTTFLTADQVGFFCNSRNSGQTADMTMLSWAQG